MNRRNFLKASGASALGLLALPGLEHVWPAPSARAAGESSFYVVCVSKANTIDKVQHVAVVSGAGTFAGSWVQGGGSLLHFDAASKPPVTVIGVGTWTAKRVVNYAPAGIAGPFAAGILDLEAEANVQAPAPVVLPFKLRVICNLGPANIVTDQPEGVVVSVPGTPFVPGGPGGPFVPFEPPSGLTALAPGSEAAAFDLAWEQEFQKVHGRMPSLQDRGDRLWSLDFQAHTGRAPGDGDWVAHWKELQGWMS